MRPSGLACAARHGPGFQMAKRPEADGREVAVDSCGFLV
jgi:hypothetical protein